VDAVARKTLFAHLVILVIISSACKAKPASEPTLTEPPLKSNPTAKPTLTPEPTSTPYPTLIPQVESNCPPGGWSQYTEEDGLADNWPRTMVVDQIGRVLVGYLIGDISLFHNGVWTSMPYTPGAPTYEINSIIPLDDGTLWVGTQGGQVALYRGGTWKMWTIQAEDQNTTVYSLEIAPDGRVWAATWNGIFQLQGDQWQPISKPVPEDFLFSGKTLFLDDEDGLWVGARRGLYYYKDGSWGPPAPGENGVQDVSDIEIDRFGNLWFSGPGGVLVFDGSTWTRVYPSGSQYDPGEIVSVNGIAFGPDERVWIADSEGVSVYENGVWQTVIPGVGSADIKLTGVEIDPWGAAWFTANEGVLCYNP